jgi:hypothetical protein
MRGRGTVPSDMLTNTMAAGLLGPVDAASPHVAVPRGDRPTCEDHMAGWPQKETS